MTRFVGDSVSVRGGKGGSGDSMKQRKKNMEKFQETGQHPELERMQHSIDKQIPALPLLDVHRQYIFMDISLVNKPLGRLIIELFDDIVPAAANHLRNRCMPGSSAGLAGTQFHKLLPHYAIYGGYSPRAGEGMRLQPSNKLRHVEAGTVSISHNGEEIAFALSRALDLDKTHQVVGRIHRGRELLDQLADLRTTPADDAPVHRVTITKCGATNHKGEHEDLEDSAAHGGPPKDMATRLQEASAEARSSVMAALQVGLGSKRKADGPPAGASTGAAGPSSQAAAAGAGAGGGGSAAATAPAAAAASGGISKKAKGMLDSVLGMGGSDDDDDDESGSSSDGGAGGG